MKVLHVISTGQLRGAEIFAADLIRALNGGAIDQRVAVLRGEKPMPAAYAAPTLMLDRGARIPGIRMEVRSAMSLIEAARDWKPDVVQAHGGEPLKYALLAAGRSGARVVYRRIGLVPPRATGGVSRVAHGTLMRRAHRVVAVAEAVRQETIRLFGVSPDRVVTIPRGVDRNRLRSTRDPAATRHDLGIARGTPVVLSLGALTWEKDPQAHLDTMALVRREVPDAVHLMAGDGPLRSQVARAVEMAGSAQLTKLLGTREDVAELLAMSDVLLLASRSEGMPGCVIEAGMAGVPVAAYEVAGVSEVVQNGVTGFTVPRGEIRTLADRLITLLSDPDLRAELGATARSHCEELFDISIIAPTYRALYEEVAA